MKAALVAAFALSGCVQADPPSTPVNPGHAIKIMSESCSPNHGRPRADVAVQNVGSTTIEWPKVMVSFGGAVHDTYLNPDPIRPGGIATGTLYAAPGESDKCTVVAVVGSDAFPATLSR